MKVKTNAIACRLCASRSVSPLFYTLGQLIIRCGDCGYIQIEERPSAETLDEIYGEQYFASSKYKDQSTLLRENMRRLTLLKRFLGINRRQLVLDVGCATGDFLVVVKSDYEAYGCDVSESAVQDAIRKNPDLENRIQVANIEIQTASRGLFFDAICMWDVIEHLWDPVSAIASLSRMLRPGGYLLLSTPNIGALVARIMGKRWAFMTPPEHMGFFCDKPMRILLEDMNEFSIKYMNSKGKWTNLGFVVHKIGRVFPSLASERISKLCSDGRLARLPLYVPTGDILYVVAQKREKSEIR